MRYPAKISVLNRRTFLVAAGGAVTLTPFLVYAETAGSQALDRTPQFHAAFERLVGSTQLIAERITVELPELAENGNFVPITMTVDSPMTEADHVKAIHILSTANPVAHVATFRLSPVNGIARVQSRMRLAKTQEVITLAELSNAEYLLINTTLVKVTIGGCAS